MEERERPLWTFAAGSVTGARHSRSGAPNQDRAGLRFPSRDGMEGEPFGGGVLGTEPVYVSARDRRGPYVLAVADGHGGDRYTRSDRGAQLAVEAALDVLSEDGEAICAALAGEDESKRLEIAEGLSHRIVEVWRQRVYEDDGNADAPGHETPASGTRPRRPTQASRAQTIPYGTTLLAALVGGPASFYFQIGDGGVVVVNERPETVAPHSPSALGGTYRDSEEEADQGEITPAPPSRLPEESPRAARVFERDTRPGEETDSLCQPDPTQSAQVEVVVGPPPALVLLATDGYEKAFADEEGFLAAATDFLDILSEPGGEAVLSEQLEGWLAGTSADGTGDDTSIALAYRSGSESAPEPAVAPASASRSALLRTVGAAALLALIALVVYALLPQIKSLP